MDAPWPYGAGRFVHDIEYTNPDEQVHVDIQPDLQDWVRATQIPLTLVIGSEDKDPQPKRPGHRGTTRIDLAINWRADMNALAEQRGLESKIRFRTARGIGHDSQRLTPLCIEALFEANP